MIFDVEPRRELVESNVRVLVDGDPRDLEAESPVVRALRREQERRRRFGVYAPGAHLEAVRRATGRRLGIDTEP